MLTESPWGRIQIRQGIEPGIWQVWTAGHGGVMVERAKADTLLSPAAQMIGQAWDAWLCFGDDGAWAVVALEHPVAWARALNRARRGPVTARLVLQGAERLVRERYPQYFGQRPEHAVERAKRVSEVVQETGWQLLVRWRRWRRARRLQERMHQMRQVRAARYRGIERQLHPRPPSPAEAQRQRKIQLKAGYFAQRYRR